MKLKEFLLRCHVCSIKAVRNDDKTAEVLKTNEPVLNWVTINDRGIVIWDRRELGD